ISKELRGFLKYKRQGTQYRPVGERLKDYAPVFEPRTKAQSEEQGKRCMDCGTPFCHWGCPVGNYIPEWNEAVAAQNWEKAFQLLDATNNLPEVTGRVCPAPCEFACVLCINDDAVTIRENEFSIIEAAFKKGLVKPRPPKTRTGKKVAVIGSGPAGLACAAQLNRAGHSVTVFERDEKPGGLMRFGIPDFKLEKEVLERRLKVWEKEGIEFITGQKIIKPPVGFDATVLAGGARAPRDLKIEGREVTGIHFALEYLVQANRGGNLIDAKGKKVVVIGCGDTGSDCVGAANRQGASKVVQIELLPQPPVCRPAANPWPTYPLSLKTSSSHEEGVERLWGVQTKGIKASGHQGAKILSCVKLDFLQKDEKGCSLMKEVPGSEFGIEADLVFLALGFLGPEKEGLLKNLGVELDARGNVKTGDNYMSSVKGVFAAGDMRRGQSLIVWAISEGRRAARAVDEFLMGRSDLPAI